MDLKDIELEDIRAVTEALLAYMRGCVGGRSSRPALGKNLYIWLAKKLLAIESFGGRWTLSQAWREVWIGNAIDPWTQKVDDACLFEEAVRRLLRRKERLESLKGERRRARNGVAASSGANEGVGKGGEETSTPQPLTPRGQQEGAAMLRAIRSKMGAPKAPLKPLDPRSLYRPPKPARVTVAAPPTGSMWDENGQPPLSPPSEKFAAFDRSETKADLSAELGRVRQRFGNL